ncbi:ATP-binding protein [Clostridium magnum]|uniref:Gliding motility regulatory protein n=1 Tax=Clostridium magnum DSM 2767 TaxID=1121326 RepID=A0A162TCC2_9CLOT|nr:ATP-binding protein [Clostridium magnum]KZL92464.1 gliding motility regulatory protein [Clostridium magnum DSM 2767]SHI26548.1 two-component system, chemotaxis family, sensor kinase CheA [Clostridium magnum DSM 2767]
MSDLFDRENFILDEAYNIAASDEYKDCKLYEKYKKLTKEYKKLIKQSIKIINISDSQHNYLNELQNELKLILDNTGQCIFTTNEELIIEENYSAECVKIFGKKVGNEKFTELIRPYNSHDNIQVIEQILNKDIFSENEFKRKVLLKILPEEIVYKNKTLSLACKLIMSDLQKSTEQILFLLMDVTEKKLLEKKIKDEQSKFETATKIISNNSLFKKLLKEYIYFSSEGINKLLNKSFDKITILQVIMKEIHTFKGNFAMFDMEFLVRRLHEIEELIVDMKEKNKLLSKEDIIKNIYDFHLEDLIKNYLQKLGEFIDNKYLEFEEKDIVVSKAKLEQLEQRLKQIKSVEAQIVLDEIYRLKFIDFSKLLEGYPQYVLKLAEKEEKLVNPFNIESEEHIPVDENKYYNFTKSLVNIFRNAVKHGIELPIERLEVGKSKTGNIGCRISKNKNMIIIEIFDDGYGMDIDELRIRTISKKERLQNMVSISVNNSEYITFSEGISTLNEIDEIGGRGEGMLAVINELNSLHGKLEIDTEKSKGTILKFILPYN